MPELKIVPVTTLKSVKDLPGGTIFKVPATGNIYVKVSNPSGYKMGPSPVNIINPYNGMTLDHIHGDAEVEIVGQLKLV